MANTFTINGVRVESDGEYGDDEGGVYFYDDAHNVEIVMWDSQEWMDEPSLVFVLMEAIHNAQKGGVESVAGRFDPHGLHRAAQDPHGLHRAAQEDQPQGELSFIVGINADPPVRLRRFATEDEASNFIGTLEGAEGGRYYIDNMNERED